MSDRFRSGNAITSVVLLLAIVAGAGAWNYHRNLQVEKASEGARPYESYATADLESLQSAYTMELESVRAQLAHTKSQRGQVERDRGSIAMNVEQFAKTAHTSSAIRDAAANVAERQSQIAELKVELELREHYGQGMARHMTLLLKVDDLFGA